MRLLIFVVFVVVVICDFFAAATTATLKMKNDGYCSKANRMVGSGQIIEAVVWMEQCVKTEMVNDPTMLHNLGALYLHVQRPHDALSIFQQVVKLVPHSHVTNEAISKTYSMLGEHSKAADFLMKAMAQIRKDDIVLLAMTTEELKASGRFDEAISLIGGHLSRLPLQTEVLALLASIASSTGSDHLMHRCLQTVVRIQPNDSRAHWGLGIFYEHQVQRMALDMSHKGDPRKAIYHYDRASRAPEYTVAAGVSSLSMSLSICDWKNRKSREEVIVAALDRCLSSVDDSKFCESVRQSPAPQPHQLLKLEQLSPLTFLKASRWMAAGFGNQQMHRRYWSHRSSTKVRLGYVSSDFTNHATTHLMKGSFKLHNTKIFEIYGVSLAPEEVGRPVPTWRRDISRVVKMHEITPGEPAEKSLEYLRGLAMDIAINLNGWTAGNRNDLFQSGIAPLQVLHLGYPATMASEYIDYFIGDAVTCPPENSQHFTEKLILLPGTYYSNDYKNTHMEEAMLEVNDIQREKLGIPRNSVVVTCLNQFYKISEAVFKAWMKVLRKHSNAVLLLINFSDLGRLAILNQAKKMGINPNRIIITPKVGIIDFLGVAAQTDVFADTFPVTAHTVAMDALWMGVPIVTFPGASFASRVSSSVSLAAGEAVTIARNIEDYEVILSKLVANVEFLRNEKKKLKTSRFRSRLFDTASAVNYFETGMKCIWDIYQMHLPHYNVVIFQ